MLMMMRRFIRLSALLLAAILLSGGAYAQSSVSTIEGTVTDEQGAVLPGATATLTGPRGDQTVTTDEKGIFRFISVQPGTYSLKLDLGTTFAPQTREVVVGLGKTAVVDFTMKMASLSETVNVVGAAAAVDVRSSATDTTVPQNMLQLTPLYSSTATGLLNAAPGINSSSGYGGQGTYGNALLLDGVDTRDPEGGSAWTFFNQNLIEEIQIGGLGAPAEYGGFTGAIINTVTKSGGNAFSGLFSMRYTNEDLSSQNVSAAQLEANENLGNAAILKKLKDYTVQMGGPLKTNKAFFFASVQRYSAISDPTGPVANSQDISPRINLKFTLQPTSRDTFVFGTQYDQYNVTGRVGYWPSAQATDRQTVEEDAPEWVWNAQWRRQFGTSALFEAKLTGYDGYYYLDPIDATPFTYDAGTDTYSNGGGGGQYYADRSRNQLQTSLTKYAEKFGSHSFKFGAEIERSHVRSRYQPYGPAGFYNYQYYGVPYYRVSYGYDLQGDNRRTTAYAQDQWSAGRVTLNLGVRLDHIRGYSPVLKENVYRPQTSWGPRVGAAYNLTQNSTSVLRGFWGRYYEGAASAFFTAATPGIQDYTHTPVDDNFNPIGPPEVIVPGQIYAISDDIKHPRSDEFNVSFEQQLKAGMRFTATGIWRWGGNFINNVIAGARWSPVTLNNSLTGGTLTAYNWVNQAASNESFTIQNPEDFDYLGTNGQSVLTAKPERKYKGLMLVLSNGLRNRIGYQFSYVLSKAEGNVDNSGFAAYLGGTSWSSPNNLINAYGELTNSRRHEIKAYFAYQIPVVDVMVGGNYTGLSGRPYTPTFIYGSSLLSVGGSARRTIFLAPRGSERTDFIHQVDLRLEKVFNIQGNRFGVYADTINLFNANGVTTRQATYPRSGGIEYKSPTGIQGARQITFGGRWSF